MSAEDNKTARIYVELSDVDREDGVKLKEKRGTYTYTGDQDSGKKLSEVVFGDENKTLAGGYEQVFELLLDTTHSTVKKDKYTDVKISVYDNKGRFVETYSENGTKQDIGEETVYNGYKIVITVELDHNKAGYAPDANGNGDDIDDRLQPIVSVVEQSKPGSSIYLSETHDFVVNKGDNVAKLVSEDKYDGDFPLFDDVHYDSEEDVDYIFAYEGDLTNVTKDVEVKANYVKDGKDVKRFGKVEAEEEKEYDELDANKDGVVSCEEALGKGWVWNNETSACELKGSSNTGSYVPNTATK